VTPEEAAVGVKPFAVGDCMREHAELQRIAFDVGLSDEEKQALREAGGADEHRNSP